MAKALIGHLELDQRIPRRLASDNARLRARVDELERLVRHLQEENDLLVAERSAGLLDLDAMLPA